MNSKKEEYSVIILTKNRSQLLRKCLRSLIHQTKKPDEIILVDNNSTDNTPSLVAQYSDLLKIDYYKKNINGYPKLYNFAISKATKDNLCFLDDDCVASKNWLKNISIAHEKHPQSVIQGHTDSITNKNIYAEIMGDHYQNWLIANKNQFDEMKTIDNKNILMPRSIIKRGYIFDKTLTLGSEDIDLGKKLVRNNIKIIYARNAKAFHHERDNFKGFIMQHLRIAKAEGIVDSKLDKKQKVKMVINDKNLLNIKSFVKRELKYINEKNLLYFLYTPFLYTLLTIIRIYGYTKKS